MPQLSSEASKAALVWQIELGADECIGERFIDRTQEPEAGADPPARARAARPALAVSPDAPDALAAACADLDALRAAIAAHPHPLREGARNCVFADGNPGARTMIVGEGPGRDEDRLGLPFVGRSGQLLDRMLAAIGLDRKAQDPARAVYITNILPWRPLGNRTPSIEEAQTFLPFVRRHIDLIGPDIVVTMGNASTKALLDTATGITRLRGQWSHIEIGGRRYPVLAMLHPAYLLREPLDKAKAWKDLLALETKLKETGDGR